MPLDIRRASESDAERIAALLLTAFVEYEPLYTPAGFRATTLSPAEIVRRFDEGPTWIAARDEVMVGTVSAINRGTEVYLRSMAVLPTERGRGIAASLLAVVHAFAVECGVGRLSLSTTPFLSDAIRLYRRSGFREVPGQFDLYGTPLIAMVKVLGHRAE